MLTIEDKKLLAQKGISEATLEKQLNRFKSGFPYIKLKGAATIGHGINVINETQQKHLISLWEEYLKKGAKIVKFVPASGAASRMFKDLFSFINADYDTPTSNFEKNFFKHIKNFAFYNELNKTCLSNNSLTIEKLLQQGNYKTIVRNLLLPQGMNYGQLPKALLLFHNYDDCARTAMEEHLIEAALYASTNNNAELHFTVSHEHLPLFKKTVAEKAASLEKKFGISFHISFSEQKSSTDTIAVNTDNTPFRNDDGSLLFRPGGHGALIENLNDIDADILFIKTIDNISPDNIKKDTVIWKKTIAGLLVKLQKQIFKYLHSIETGDYSSTDIKEMLLFLQNKLYCKNINISNIDNDTLVTYIKDKLNRPIRVCGIVRNSGEPGGGPFITISDTNDISLQILESSQINKNNKKDMELFKNGTHFNPVDLVCGIKDFHNNRFNLKKYIDETTGFISNKSKNGRPLKALELPGLWNGAMSHWNTIFVEVPASTFNPVKTVNDLLRKEHQNI